MPKKRELVVNEWKKLPGDKVLCLICHQHQNGYGVSPIERKSVAKHIKTTMHKEAVLEAEIMEANNGIYGEDLSLSIEYDGVDPEVFDTSIELVPPENFVSLPSVELETPQHRKENNTLSQLIQQLVYINLLTDEDFADDPFDKLQENVQTSNDDAPIYWNDKRFAAEMGFGGEELPDLETDDTMSNVMQRLSLQGFAEDLASGGHATNINADEQWFPYPNKTYLILDSIDSLPRLRMSESMMRVIIWALNEAGAKDVPSFTAFRKFQQGLRAQSNISTRMFQSVMGNKFYMNDLGALLAKDFSNVLVRPHLQFYPEETGGSISEVWHAEKWNHFPPEYLTPMYIDAVTNHHFYVREIAQMEDGQFVFPLKWIIHNGVLVADANPVTASEDFVIEAEEFIRIAANKLRHNFPALVDKNVIPMTSSHIVSGIMPNPLRQLAGGEPLYTIFIDEWNDDVSGNQSKSYNKHFNTYVANRNLPRRLLQQEFHVHFLGTSQFASAVEQNAAVKEMMLESQRIPIQAYDCLTHSSCRFRIFKNAAPADNPMQSEMCSHIGSGGNKKCRRCNTGGNTEFVESTAGFHSLFSEGSLRNAKETYKELKKQLLIATRGVKKTVSESQTSSGIKDKIVQAFIDKIFDKCNISRGGDVQTARKNLEKWVEDNEENIINPSLTMPGFDPHSDTPIELLHTISLGTAKYIWHSSHLQWKELQQSTFSVRLQAANVDGLSIHPIRASYIMTYANSLIGRQFKTLIQLAVFQLHDLVTADYLSLWKALGELSALLWYPEIQDLPLYLSDVDICIANILDLFAKVEPSRMVNKIKLHLLTHIISDIKRFGPLIGESTEVFECFNAIFRTCSVYSNRQAPSRDIAIQFAELEGAKQRISGGYWRDNNGRWVRCGPAAQLFFKTAPVLQGHLGWVIEMPAKPGVVKATAKQSLLQNQKKVSQLKANKAINASDINRNIDWIVGTSVVAKSGDLVKVGSWVFANSPFADETIIGRVTEIITSEKSSSCHSLVLLDEFKVCAERHKVFAMPVLRRHLNEQKYVVVKAETVLFSFNVQHDCTYACCTDSGIHHVLQERMETNITQKHIEHKDIESHIINLHALHNPHLIRWSLPRHVWAPTPVINPADRLQKHTEYAKVLHATQTVKRAKTKEKRAAKTKELVERAAKLVEIDRTGDEEENCTEIDGEVTGPNEAIHDLAPADRNSRKRQRIHL